MIALPRERWQEALLALVEHGQLAVRKLCHTLGLAAEVHGQPAWPWSRRLASETLLIDLGLARALAWTLTAIVLALVLAGLALAWRRRRAALLLLAAATLVVAPWPTPAALFAPAMSTSFHVSPTGFRLDTIARGETIYVQHCAACHGADGRGEGPRAASLTHWPPSLAGTLLTRRADGELFGHIVNGMRDHRGSQTMPGFAGTLRDADIWAVLDYMKALAAGTSATVSGSWAAPLRIPELPVHCGDGPARPLSVWRSSQRVRIVAFDGEPARLPYEDPRFLTLLVTRDGMAPAPIPAFRAGCVAASSQAWSVFARLAGLPPDRLAGTELLADRAGWLRARGMPGSKGWSDADMLCTSTAPGTSTLGSPPAGDGLTALLLRMDADPVRFVKGGVVH